MLADPEAWVKYKVKCISQVVANSTLRPLTHLCSDFIIPATYSFYYMQLSHTFNSQFPQTSLQMVQSTLEQVLRTDYTEMPTTHLYAHLISVSLPNLGILRARWQRDILLLDDDDCEDIWDFIF